MLPRKRIGDAHQCVGLPGTEVGFRSRRRLGLRSRGNAGGQAVMATRKVPQNITFMPEFDELRIL